MQTSTSSSEVAAGLAVARAPMTIALVVAGLVAFAVAAFTLYDAYSDRRERAEELAVSRLGVDDEPRSRALADELGRQRALAEQRLVQLQRVTAEAERETAEARAALRQCEQQADADGGVSGCEEWERQASAARAALARVERELGAVDEQAAALQRLAVELSRGAGREELAAQFARLRRAIAEIRRLAGSGSPQEGSAAASPERPAEMMLAMTEPEPAGPSPVDLAWARLYIVIGMFAVLGLAFLAAVVAIFTTSRPAVLAFALDTVKTMIGFFVGVVTAFMSAPG